MPPISLSYATPDFPVYKRRLRGGSSRGSGSSSSSSSGSRGSGSSSSSNSGSQGSGSSSSSGSGSQGSGSSSSSSSGSTGSGVPGYGGPGYVGGVYYPYSAGGTYYASRSAMNWARWGRWVFCGLICGLALVILLLVLFFKKKKISAWWAKKRGNKQQWQSDAPSSTAGANSDDVEPSAEASHTKKHLNEKDALTLDKEVSNEPSHEPPQWHDAPSSTAGANSDDVKPSAEASHTKKHLNEKDALTLDKEVSNEPSHEPPQWHDAPSSTAGANSDDVKPSAEASHTKKHLNEKDALSLDKEVSNEPSHEPPQTQTQTAKTHPQSEKPNDSIV